VLSVVLSGAVEIDSSRSLRDLEASASRRLSSAATRVWTWSSRSLARVLSLSGLDWRELTRFWEKWTGVSLVGVNVRLGSVDRSDEESHLVKTCCVSDSEGFEGLAPMVLSWRRLAVEYLLPSTLLRSVKAKEYSLRLGPASWQQSSWFSIAVGVRIVKLQAPSWPSSVGLMLGDIWLSSLSLLTLRYSRYTRTEHTLIKTALSD